MDDRKKILELYSKQLNEGNPLAEEFVNPKSPIQSQALQARNLAEDALANEVLKNTGVPIPGTGASTTKKEDFLNRIIKERYPELEPNVSLKPIEGTHGLYNDGNISVNPKTFDKDLYRGVGTSLHEAGHQFDDKILKFDGTDDVKYKDLKMNAPKGKLLTDVDPAQAYEIMAKGHHANIPNLREGTFGLGALKSMLKTGTFKALPYIGAGLTGAAALSTPDASAAVADFAIPGGLDSLGPSEEDAAIENPQGNQQLRQEALKKLTGK